MSSYGVNGSVPKTLVQYLIRWYARHRADEPMRTALDRVLDTPISPELVPSEDDEVAQQTESIVGPYELHDFFIYHYLRNGFGVEKIFALAVVAHAEHYSPAEIRKWLRVFIQRFHTQQFKRTTLPAGPKIGSVSLSPRGDWRMPDEASFSGLLDRIDAIEVDL
jgi:NAD+ synthase (glutamine-hydrolysing)